MCFRCDEKYTVGHRCKNKEIQVLIVDDERGDLGVEEEARMNDTHESAIDEIAELSINSMVGLSAPKTMKVKGKISQQDIVVMIDCGATHNFISTKLVKRLAIPMEGTTG